MHVFQKSFSPPLELKTDRFHLFPTSLDFFQSDYEAVMDSRELLRLWSQSEWPEDNFTAEQNRDDLKHHVTDNVEHHAYGFMLYTLDHSKCLGSVYVNPLAKIVENYQTSDEDIEVIRDADARIDWWVAASVDADLERHILESLRDWLSTDWKVRALFGAREGMTQRLQIYDSIGLQKVATLRGRDPNVGLLLYR